MDITSLEPGSNFEKVLKKALVSCDVLIAVIGPQWLTIKDEKTADTQCGPHQRQKLERLCRYITRPALGHKRLPRTPAGEVVLQLKTPYRNSSSGTIIRKITYYSISKK